MSRPATLQLFAAAASLVLWALPGAGMVVLPLEYLNTHIHEFCHALVAVATGGDVQYIKVFGTGSGVTPIAGGSLLLAASAGYVGASFIGGLILLAAHTEKGAKNALTALCAVLVLSMVLWVRGDAIGLLSGAMWIITLFLLARFLKGDAIIFAAQFIGIQQCLRSAQALYTLLNINAFTEIQNDAVLAEKATHLPSLFWAIVWFAISAAWMAAALRRSWGGRSPRGRPTG